MKSTFLILMESTSGDKYWPPWFSGGEQIFAVWIDSLIIFYPFLICQNWEKV